MYSFLAMNPTGKVKTGRVRGTLRLEDIIPSSKGMEFVKKIIKTLEHTIQNSLRVGETLYTDVTEGSTTVKKKTAITFKWEGDVLVLDNMDVYAQGVHWKYFGFVELALNMGWLKDNPVHEGHPSYYSPNMLMEPTDKKGPKADYTKESFYDGSVFKEFPNNFANGPVGAALESQGWPSLYQGAQFMVMARP